MPASTASAAADTGINAPGGSISENSPGLIVVVVVAVVVIFVLYKYFSKGRA